MTRFRQPRQLLVVELLERDACNRLDDDGRLIRTRPRLGIGPTGRALAIEKGFRWEDLKALFALPRGVAIVADVNCLPIERVVAVRVGQAPSPNGTVKVDNERSRLAR